MGWSVRPPAAAEHNTKKSWARLVGSVARLTRSHGPLTRLSGVVAARAPRLPRRLKGGVQPLELARVQRGERAQQLGLAQNARHVHAHPLPEKLLAAYPH